MSYWDRHAAQYARLGRAPFWLRPRLAIIEDLRDARVLDAGCGGGELVHALLEQGCDAYGVDFSTEMVGIAAETVAEAGYDPHRISRADICTLPFPTNAFDCVVATGVLGLLSADDQGIALSELARVARYEVRLLEPFARRDGVYPARVLGWFFDGQTPLHPDVFEEAGLDIVVGWRAVAGVFTYIHGVGSHSVRSHTVQTAMLV